MKTISDRFGILPNINLHPVRSHRAIKAEKSVYMNRETWTLSGGKLYAYSGREQVWCSTYSEDQAKAILALGMTTKEQFRKWAEARRQHNERADVRQAARDIAKLATMIGVKLTKAQIAAIERAKV